MAVNTILPIVPGEPFDLAYLSKIAEYLSNFNVIMEGYSNSMASINNQITTMKKTKIITKSVRVGTGQIKKGDHGHHTWKTDFGGVQFKYNPTVMATAYIPTLSQASNSCWLDSITTGSVSGKFAFMEGPFNNETVYVWLMIVGVLP